MSEKTITVEIPLRWGDMDAYGHVNNVTLVQIMEEARVAVFGPPPSAGEIGDVTAPIPVFSQLPPGTQALVAENHVKYRAPLPYRNMPARVEVRVEKVTAASLTIGYRIIDPGTGAVCCTCTTVLAFVDGTTGRLMRIGPAERALLAEHVAA